MLLIVLQALLGIATLLTFVQISLALGHQALAFMLCGAIVAYLADMTGKTAR
jgi:cytochrome c oxidase assembly protein subunit 15